MADEANKIKLLIQVLRKIPIFTDLSPTQLKKVLGLCVHRQCEPGDIICTSGTPSDEMYVLLSGEIAIVTPEGAKVATLVPVTTVGEMGLVTGQPRNATAEATRPTAIFIIHKPQFEFALSEEPDMKVKVYRSIIDILSTKLNNDNVRLRDFQIGMARSEGRISILERRMEEHRQRLELAIAMAATSSDRSVDEIGLHIDDQVKDLVPRILIVDDEPAFCALVHDALPAFEVVAVGNGREALDVVHEEKLDLVITDIRMPEMDGIALLKNLNSQFPSLPVIAVSGYADRGEIEEHDFDGFAEKPLSPADLRVLVEDTIAKTGS
jgi:CheY-like chemotaxis protein